MNTNLDRILKLEVPIVVQLGVRQMSVAEIVSLSPGSIIELNKNADDELEVMVNNQQIGTGCAVKVGENFGVEITYIGDLKDRVRALGTSDQPSEEDAEADDLAAALLAGQV